jgi:metal-responsive CopG/Arc/MetJ family transcriptional regulator
MEKKRLNVLVPENILEKIDQCADEAGLNRTSMVLVMVKHYIDQQDALRMSNLLGKGQFEKLIRSHLEGDLSVKSDNE